MARMLASVRRVPRCCKNCVVRSDGRFAHGGRKDPRFRKLARAADKRSWRRAEAA